MHQSMTALYPVVTCMIIYDITLCYIYGYIKWSLNTLLQLIVCHTTM